MELYEGGEGQEQDDHSISDMVRAESQLANQEVGQLKVNAKAAQEIPQDKAARVLEMRARTKLDAGIIERNLEEIEKDDALGYDWDMFRKTSPRLAQWYMESPDHIAVVKPVLGPAMNLERIFYRKDDASRPLTEAEIAGEVARTAKRRAPKMLEQKQAQTDASGMLRTDDLGRPYYQGPEGNTVEEIEKNAAAQIREDILKREAFIANSEKVGPVEAVARTFEENPFTLIPFLKDLPPLAQAAQLISAQQAVEAGTADDDQKDMLMAFGRVSQAAERRGTNLPAQVAELVVNLPATGLEFALTGGAYRAGKVGVEAGIRGAVKKVLSGTAERVARKTVGVMAGAATQAVVMSPVMVAQDTVRRMAPNVDITADKAGELGSHLTDGEGGGKAFLKSLGSAYVQTLSERTGIIPEKLVAPLKRIAFGRWMAKNPSSSVGKFLEKVGEKTGWNGVLGEVFEERAAELMEAGIGVSDYKLPTAEQVLSEFIAFSAPGAAHTAIEKTASFVSPKQKQGAERTAELVKELTGAVQEMGLNDKRPQVAEAIVGRMVQGTDAEDARIPVEVWNTFYQDKKDEQGAPLSPRQVFADVGGDPAAYDEAKRTGGKVVIPTKTYLTSPALEEGRKFFQDHVVFDPLQMSKQETKDIIAQEQAKAQEAQQLEQAKAEVEARDVARQAAVQKAKDSVEKVNDAIRQGLEASGFKKEAAAYGNVVASVFKTLGQRENIDPFELFSERPLTIERQGDLPVDKEGQVYQQPAYHGSPHKFDKFDIKKLGTGEGHQAYGWGLYFAGNKAVAKHYRNMLSDPNSPVESATIHGKRIEAAAKEIAKVNGLSKADVGNLDYLLERVVRDMVTNKASAKSALKTLRELYTHIGNQNLKRLVDIVSSISPSAFAVDAEPGRLYSVEIPEDVDFLDYDKPVSQQSKKVRAALEKLNSDTLKSWGKGLESASGQAVYDALSNELGGMHQGGDEAASKKLLSAGIPGIKYLDQNSRDSEEGTSNYVLFDDKHVKVNSYEQPNPDDMKPARGRIKIGNASIRIDLLKEADPSTFLHETGHLYLDLIDRLAKRPEASLQIREDVETVRKWLGAKEGEEFTTDQHEKWAKSFEAYLMEGKAPSLKLRGAFYRFKEWLSDVYQGLKEVLGFDLNDNIRSVMDRMLATSEEIAEAQQEQAQIPLFDDAKAAGATDVQADRYAKLTLKARETAEAKLLDKTMRQVRREREQWWKDERKKLRTQVEAEVNQEPVYRAVSVLQTGKLPDGSELPPGTFSPGIKELKIDRASIAPLFGGQYGDVDLRMFPKGISAPEGGLHPDIIAGMFGFETGRELMVALQGMEDKKDKIDRITDERMAAEHGAEPTEEEIKEAALASIHNEDRAEQIQLEMQILARKDTGLLKLIAGGVIPNMDILRRDARRAVLQTKLRNINPKQYAAAERKAARNALNAYAKGDVKTALYEKRLELVNLASFEEADKAREEYDKFLEDIRPIVRVGEKYDEKIAKTRDIDFVNAARAVLARVNIGKVTKAASEYLAAVKEYDPQKYEDLIGMVNAAVPEANREIHDLTYEEFKALKEAVEALWEGSSSSRHVEIRGKRITIDEAKAPMIARMDEIEPAQKSKRAKTDADKNIGKLLGARAALTRVEHWAHGMGRAFVELFSENIHEATDAYNDWKNAQLNEYEERLKKLPKIKNGEIHSDDLDFTFSSKRQLIGALLHMGNSEDGASNKWKYLLGWEFANLKEDGTGLDTTNWDRFIEKMMDQGVLTKEDFDFVQSVWDQFEKIKPEVQKAHRKLRNVYFSEITATPFTNRFGTYRGGYYPALADPAEEAAAAVRGEKAEAEVGNAFSLPTAGSGATKHRSKAYWKKLRMDLNAIPEHLKWAGRYIHIEPKIADLRRLMWDKEFRERLDKFNPNAAGDMLMPWLQRTAMQKVEAPMKHGTDAARWLRKVAGAKQIGLNFINAAQNYEGLFVALTKVHIKHLAPAFKDVHLHPVETHKAIVEKSAYMRNVSQEVVGSLTETSEEILHDPSPLQNFKQWANKNIYFASKMTQAIVSNVVWTGAYNEAYEKNPAIEDADAVKHADSVVRTTQGSSAPEDISAFEAGTAFHRLFTMYTSWFNMRANLLGSEAVRIRRETGLPNKKARYLHLAAMGFVVPALVGAAIKKLLKNEDLDPDDDGYLDDFMAFLFGSTAREAQAMLPVVGPALDVMINRFDKNPMNDTINVSPAVAVAQGLAQTPGDIYNKVRHGKGKDSKAAEDVLTLFNAITGIPTAAVAQEVGYMIDVAEGERKATGPIDLLRGALTGSGGRKK